MGNGSIWWSHCGWLGLWMLIMSCVQSCEESRNHRMIWVGRHLKNHPFQPPCHKQGHFPLDQVKKWHQSHAWGQIDWPSMISVEWPVCCKREITKSFKTNSKAYLQDCLGMNSTFISLCGRDVWQTEWQNSLPWRVPTAPFMKMDDVGQAGPWGLDKPGMVEALLGIGARWALKSLPAQSILWFYVHGAEFRTVLWSLEKPCTFPGLLTHPMKV